MKMDKQRTFLVNGMHCAGCAAAVERAVKALPVKDVYVNFASGRLNFVSADGIPADAEVISAVKKAGFRAELPPAALTPVKEESLKKDVFLLISALCFTVLLMVICMGHIPANAQLNGAMQLLCLLPVLWAGRGFFLRGFPALFRGAPNMDSLISCGSAAGIIYSVILMIIHPGSHLYFDSAAMIISLIMLGKLLEKRSRRSASSAIRQLLELTPPESHLVRDGKEVDVPSADLLPGDVVRIRPGEKIPADGVIIEGGGFVNESMLTGEELPASRSVGDKVCGGTLNVDGSLLVKVTTTGQSSILGQIVKLIDDAQNTRPPVAALADKVSGIFVWIIFSVALVTAVAWWIGGSGAQALHFSLSVLVVACPCALGLATPIALISGIGRGARNGILIKNGSALENAAKLQQLVFDKTGTLTAGMPMVKLVKSSGLVSADELLQFAASAECFSEHPLARAVVSGAEERSLPLLKDVGGFTSLAGKGITVEIFGTLWCFGNAALMREYAVEIPGASEELSGLTLIYIARNGEYAGVIGIGDIIRPEAYQAVKELKDMGIGCYMLTGDNHAAAAAVAEKLAVDGFKAGLLPQEKVAALQSLRNGITGMVGDGINDAPALAASDLGIAIGSGSDIALESADVVLLRSDLSEVVQMVKLSKATFRVIRQNLFWAFFYNICGIPLAAGVIYLLGGAALDPAFCAGAMACSSLTVVLNALRLRFFRG